MSRIFISHSSKDNFEAVAMRGWLAGEGWDDVFLDLDPERGITAGERWERALHQAAQRCEAVIFLVSTNWLVSGWCRKEYELSRSLNKQLLAVLIDTKLVMQDIPPEFRGVWQVVDLRPGTDGQIFAAQPPGSHEEKQITWGRDGLRRLKRGLEKAGLDPSFFAWPPATEAARAPYRGLRPLEAADAGIFFGRDAPIVEAIDRLRGIGEGAPPRLLVILGASGAGKSSFLRAGLLPRLARDDRHFLCLPPIRPERAALTGENGFLGALEAALPGRGRAALRTAIAAGAAGVRPLLAEWVRSAVGRTLGDEALRNKPPAVVIAVDQAEELFRTDGGGEGAALLELLRALTAMDEPAVIAVFAIRSDSYDALEHAKALEGVPQATLPLLPLPRGAYAAVIEGPARRATEGGGKLVVEPRLAQRLLDDIEKGGGSDALPLLAFTLEQLWLEYGRAGALRLADYEAFGGLRGAIDAAVKRAFARADVDARIPRDPAAREALLRRGLIPWLAGIDPDTRSPRRNIARRDDIPAEAAPLIDLLVEERLLATDTVVVHDAAMGPETRIATIEPAHEALLRQWGVLQGWLAEDFGLLATLEGVKRAARDWDANAQAQAWLAHGGQRLAEAQALDARPDIAAKLDPVDRAYLAGCRTREEAMRAEAEARRREREEEQARRIADAEAIAAGNKRIARRTLAGLAVASALAALATTFGFYAFQQSKVAKKQTAVAKERTAAAVQSRNEALLTQSKFLTDQAHREIDAGDATSGLLLALEALPDADSDDEAQRARPLWPPAAVALDRALRSMKERLVLTGHTDAVKSVVVMPDGARIVSGSADRTARIWDGRTGAELAVLKGHLAGITSIAVATDNSRIITGSVDGTARIWHSATGATVAVLKGHADQVSSVAISPDGSRIVTGSQDKTARVWDANTGVELGVLRGHTAGVSSVAFSPDGRKIVTGSADGTLRIWSSKTGDELTSTPARVGSTVVRVYFGRNERRISVGLDDGGVEIFNLETSTQPRTFQATQTLGGMTTTPDESRVATASATSSGEGIVSLWEIKTGHELARRRVRAAGALSVAVTRDGAHLVSGHSDGTIRIWDTDPDTGSARLEGHTYAISALAVTSDSTRVVTGSLDGTARIWQLKTRTSVVLKGHTGPITAVAVTHDASRIITASQDGTVRVWDETGTPLHILRDSVSSVDQKITNMGVTPDGTRVVTAGNIIARIWDIKTGRTVTTLAPPAGSNAASTIVISPDGRRSMISYISGLAVIWNNETGTILASFSRGNFSTSAVAFSPDGQRVITGGAGSVVRIWDAQSGNALLTLRGHTSTTTGVAFSPNGGRVVTSSSDGTARIWDAHSGAALLTLKGHSAGLTGAVLTPDGKRVVTASEDKTARVWDIGTGAELARFEGHTEPLSSIAVSPDGAHVITGSRDGTARIWDLLPTGIDLIEKARMTTPRCFSASGRQNFTLPPTVPHWCVRDGKWPVSDTASSAIFRARELVAEGKDEEADAILSLAVKHFPTATEAINSAWANIYFVRGGTRLVDAEATAQLDRALALDPSLKDPIELVKSIIYSTRIPSLIAENRFEEAKFLIDKLIAARNVASIYTMMMIAKYYFNEVELNKSLVGLATKNEIFSPIKRKIDFYNAELLHDPSAVIHIVEGLLVSDDRLNLAAEVQIRAYKWAIDWAQRNKIVLTLPIWMDAQLALGRYFIAKKRFTEAIDPFKQIKRLISMDPSTFILKDRLTAAASGVELFSARNLLAEQQLSQGNTIKSLLMRWTNFLDLEPGVRDALEANRLKQSALWREVALIYAELNKESAAHEITECDRLASFKFDPNRVAPGVDLEAIDAAHAIAACSDAMTGHPDLARLRYDRGRAHFRASALAKAAKNETDAKSHYAAAQADYEAAMAAGYPAAFNNMAYMLTHDGDVAPDWNKAAELDVQTLNRVVSCCAVPVVRRLLTDEAQYDVSDVRRVSGELLRWAAALGNDEARRTLAELVSNGKLKAANILPPAQFTDVPPWLKQ